MTVRDLIEELENMNPDAEIRIAYQPNYPLYFVPDTVVETEEQDSVYIAEPLYGSDNGYLHSEVKQLLDY